MDYIKIELYGGSYMGGTISGKLYGRSQIGKMI